MDLRCVDQPLELDLGHELRQRHAVVLVELAVPVRGGNILVADAFHLGTAAGMRLLSSSAVRVLTHYSECSLNFV
eukprot:14361515-Alexandrium_andersonii.AAC.1